MSNDSISQRGTINWGHHRFTPAWRAATLGMAVALVAAINLPAAHASTWTGAGADWSSNGSPGWNTTGVPNSTGAMAEFPSITPGTTTIGNVYTVGTLTMDGSSNTARAFTVTTGDGLTFNNSGAGATISNTDSSTGSTNRINIGSGVYTLADSLLMSNTGGSTSTSGSITINSGLAGTGNLTVYNVSNDPNSGKISLSNNSTFAGSILVKKGVFSVGGSGTALGAESNLLTIGSAGEGSASFYTTGSGTSISNDITITAGTGGTLTLGSLDTGVVNSSAFIGTMTLNDNLIISSVKGTGKTVSFTNTFSGAGGVTKIGAGSVTFSGNAGYNGDTIITNGTLFLTAPASINNTLVINLNGGSLDTTAKSSFTVGSGQTLKGQGSYAGAVLTTINGTLSVGQTHNAALGAGSTLTFSAGAAALAGADQFDLVSAAGDADKLVISAGSLAYGGTLQIANPNAITLAGGQSWDLFDFVSQSGAFANDSVFGTGGDGVNLPALDPRLAWEFNYSTGVLSIEATAVPEPASLGLLALGAMCLIRRRR